ncbi:MAG: aldo/keto reductase [Gammaproteobacteria bacterium]|nr:aldo/keto reductase [Gammaproteobacteria bacterium]
MNSFNADRRRCLLATAGLVATSLLPSSLYARAGRSLRLVRQIPGHDEYIPVIGMGSWGTFDIGDDAQLRRDRLPVLQQFFADGGTLIDSSPMYGSSEQNLGWCLQRMEKPPVFSATKVWTRGAVRGIEQMQASQSLWGTGPFDLMQIHNFTDWETHLETLREWRDEGRIRYIGITTSHGRRAEDMARVIAKEPDIDFVQFTYNIADRDAEKTLLPLALEHGKAVIINRPFQRKALIHAVEGEPLPAWASEFECENWPQFLLKYIASHPAVTCVIPATSRVDHMIENMGACYGMLPDEKLRRRMVSYFESI